MNYDIVFGISALVFACIMVQKVISIGNDIVEMKNQNMKRCARQARLDHMLAENDMKKPIDELTKL